jgi:hypothetical protein
MHTNIMTPVQLSMIEEQLQKQFNFTATGTGFQHCLHMAEFSAK